MSAQVPWPANQQFAYVEEVFSDKTRLRDGVSMKTSAKLDAQAALTFSEGVGNLVSLGPGGVCGSSSVGLNVRGSVQTDDPVGCEIAESDAQKAVQELRKQHR